MLRRLFFLTLIAAVCAAVVPTPASAIAYTPTPTSDLAAAAAALLGSLVGIPAILAAILALLEYFGKVGPETSDAIQMYANAFLYIAAFCAVLFGKVPLLIALDYYLGGIAPILVAILAFLSGGVFSVVQTRRVMEQIRSLYPFRLRARARYAAML